MASGYDRAGERFIWRIGITGAIALVYFAAAKLGLSLAFVAEQVTVVWPPTGIALAAVVLLGSRAWPGIAIGAFIANLTANAPVAVAVGIAAGNTGEALVGAWLLSRLGFRPQLDRLRDAVALIVGAAFGSTLVSATVGVLSLCIGGVEPWHRAWSIGWVWWIGDAIGALVITPLLLVWADRFTTRVDRTRLLEGMVLCGSTAFVCFVLFAGQPAWGLQGYPLHYTIFPFVLWAAVRMRQRGCTAVTFIASGIAIWSTANGLGPFVMSTTHESLIMVQLFMGIVAITGLLLGAAIFERDTALARQAQDYGALETSEGRLRIALDAGRLGVWDWNIAEGGVQWTENLEPLHGLAPGTFRGTMEEFVRLVHPDDRDRVDAAIRGALEGGTRYDVEFRNTWPDGSEHWIAAKGTVLFNSQQKPIRMIGTAADITERRRLEHELRRRAAELSEADRRKDEFLAMLAHELRNPLAPLSTSLHLMESHAGDHSAFLAIAERQVRHLVRLVDDLLDASRISRGKIALKTEIVLLQDVIARAVELTQPVITARAHALTVSLPPENVRLEADPVRLTQVIANLLTNAANYTPPGGSISLTAESVGHELTLRVRDSGMGIASELLPKVFDLFVQGDMSLDRTRGGLGIGLTLVRGLVELHGGRVEAHSGGTGRGSEFIVRLPTLASDASDTRVTQSNALRHQVAPPLRILIIDDNQDAATSLGQLLTLWGHETRTAFDGAAALTTTATFRPEVIISDLGLPGMDGFELARRLRLEPAARHAVLIALSGYGRDEDKKRSLEAGFDHHLVKPLNINWLFDLLKGVGMAGQAKDAVTLQ